MANATVSRLGLVNNTGTDFDALFLKVFSGEVLTAFARNNIFNEQLTDAINVLQKYSWWFVGGSIILVLFANARNARRS